MALPLHLNPDNADCTCPLMDSKAGTESTVVAITCGEPDARRLRSMGVYEGATISVVGKKNCLLVDVRGTRLALCSGLALGIKVQPIERASTA